MRIPNVKKVAAAAVFCQLAALAGGAEPRARFSALAVDGEAAGGRTARVEIVVNRWLTPEEVGILRAVLKDGGSTAFLGALREREEDIGHIRTVGNVGVPLKFAMAATGRDGTETIVVATDRPISFAEAWQQPRSIDYPFLVAELHLRPNGEGDGQLVPVADIAPSTDRVFEVVNYVWTPVRLMGVQKEMP